MKLCDLLIEFKIKLVIKGDFFLFVNVLLVICCVRLGFGDKISVFLRERRLKDLDKGTEGKCRVLGVFSKWVLWGTSLMVL